MTARLSLPITKSDNSPINSIQLLALACTPNLSKERAARLSEAAQNFDDWATFADQALQHRLAPLIYWHFRKLKLNYPPNVQRLFASAYLKQKAIANIQSETLCEIITVFHAAGLQPVVLKGGIVAHLLYPEPGLRPMEDLDILLPPEDAETGRQLLIKLGFEAPPPETRYQHLQHQFPCAQRVKNGHSVFVELHTTAFNLIIGDSLNHTNLMHPLNPYRLKGLEIVGMHPLQLLWMQYHGLRKLAEPLRYIQLSDLVGIIELYLNQIDWQLVQHRYPRLWHALPALHSFSPLSESACNQIGAHLNHAKEINDIGKDYRGWPRNLLSERNESSTPYQLFCSTFNPPDWWGRFFHGTSSTGSRQFQVNLRHIACIFRQGLLRLYLGPVNQNNFFKT